VVHSGTYSGHLLSVLAALATLEELSKPGLYDEINATGTRFYGDMQAIFDQRGVPAVVQGRGARFGMYFGRRDPVTTWSDALNHDHALNQRFVQGCVERGVYFHGFTRQGPPGHAGFSLAHSADDFAEALNVIDDVAATLH
jgi:glutamate-1-semialdehyde 2,1-aminomutase